MNSGARLSAAIEILDVIEIQRRPGAEVLKEWGTSHRYAGSKDRAAIGSLVFDALRVRSSAAYVMDDGSPRAILLGALRNVRGQSVHDVVALCSGEGHAPAPLSEAERQRFEFGTLDGAPDHVRGDYPEWLAGSFAAAFGDASAEEGSALARRAPVDLRVNGLKIKRDKALRSLAHLMAELTPHAASGLRIVIGDDGRAPALAAEPAYVKGFVEIQDEGSQIAALLSGAKPGDQVLDLCAGSGGKTLALAAMMDNKGQIFATDLDGRRLMPIYDRLARAGVRNVQVRAPKGRQTAIEDLDGRFDLVFVDAPCTGTGTWRRNPDAKWRLRPGAPRRADQISERDSGPGRTGHEARWTACLCDLFGFAGGKRGPSQDGDGSSSGTVADRCRSDGAVRRNAGTCRLRFDPWTRSAPFAGAVEHGWFRDRIARASLRLAVDDPLISERSFFEDASDLIVNGPARLCELRPLACHAGHYLAFIHDRLRTEPHGVAGARLHRPVPQSLRDILRTGKTTRRERDR